LIFLPLLVEILERESKFKAKDLLVYQTMSSRFFTYINKVGPVYPDRLTRWMIGGMCSYCTYKHFDGLQHQAQVSSNSKLLGLTLAAGTVGWYAPYLAAAYGVAVSFSNQEEMLWDKINANANANATANTQK
jgi:hypothetical protein